MTADSSLTPSGSSRSADRALLRLGARTARRSPLRSLLIVALLAVPVAASIVVAATQRTVNPTAEQQQRWYLGEADWTVELPFVGADLEGPDTPAWLVATDPAELAGLVTAALDGDAAVAPVWESAYQLGIDSVQVQGLDAADPVFSGMRVSRHGRYPREQGEVALTVALADRLDVGVGDHITLPGGDDVTVTGVFDRAEDTERLEMVLPEDATPLPGATHRLFVDLPDVAEGADLVQPVAAAIDAREGPGAFEDAMAGGWIGLQQRIDQFGYDSSAPLQLDRPPVLAGFVAAVLLLEVGLIAAAAFTAGTRRRLREFGLLATIGADERHVRRLVLAEALVLGAVGVVAGVVTGVVATRAFEGLISRMTSYAVTGVGNRPSEVVLPALVGLMAAVAAAWFPARSAARVPPLTALAGRMPTRPLRLRAVPVALGLLAAGLLLTGAAAASVRDRYDTSDDGPVAIMIVGCLLCLAGAATGASWVVERVGHRRRLPLSLRLVARDAARQRFRSAVAVASLVVVSAIPVMLTSVVLTEEARQEQWVVPETLPDEVVLRAWDDPLTQPVASALGDGAARVRSVLAADDVGAVQLLGVRLDDERFGGLVLQPVWAAPMLPSGGSYAGSGQVGLGTPDAVAALRLPVAAAEALAAGRPVAVAAGTGSASLNYPDSADALDDGTWTTVGIDALSVGERPVTSGTPAYLIPEEMADELGLEPVSELRILVADRPLTDGDRDAIRDAFTPRSSSGSAELRPLDSALTGIPFVSVGFDTTDDGWDPSDLVQLIALPAAALLVLVIGGCLVAVAATESDRDVATMLRVGAPPSLRRRFFGLQSAYHAALGAVLAVPVGLLLLVSLRRAITDPPPLVMPWFAIAVVAVAIPTTLGLTVAALVRGRPPVTGGGR